MKTRISTLVTSAIALAVAASATAATIVVPAGNITTSQTWTADNTYDLAGQVYITGGAILTIEAGTVVASTPTANGSGSLAVTRGSQIFVNGTKALPVIMTSTNDTATWTAGNPKTGTWREAANEWGNLTIMGRGYISSRGKNTPPVGSFEETNTKTPGNNVAVMEGLVAADATDTRVYYGGTNDNDDSGSISYLSLRYGGRVVGVGTELNGLSLGGVGRGTDINFVDIMNNVDDGIEIWGGTVNIKNFSIWNIGDDSLDVDQGWRGKAQFGLIVQGYSVVAGQGSGTGDNCLEIDGAEASDAQPTTTSTWYNMTVIGQPIAGDNGTEWRDGARVQIRQSIFMDLGEAVVRGQDDASDGEGTQTGYGFNGTLAFFDTNTSGDAHVWTTAWNSANANLVNPGTAPADLPNGISGSTPALLYTAQSAGNATGQGFLTEITDTVFYRNNKVTAGVPTSADGLNDGPAANDAYARANEVGVTLAGGSNAAKSNVVSPTTATADENMPIVALTRSLTPDTDTFPGRTTPAGKMFRVLSIDPRAANAAVTSAGTPPVDGFFSNATYRGAFGTAPSSNWLLDWTAADAYGQVVEAPGASVSDWNTIN